jgi:methylmalonyl-CoA mutase N-terminal domain/subunit
MAEPPVGQPGEFPYTRGIYPDMYRKRLWTMRQYAGFATAEGVNIASLMDMERLFDGIRLDRVSTSMTINSTASTLLALYVLVADAQGASRAKLSGTIQNDILKEYIARGTYIYPPRPAMRIITDVFAWAGREIPEWNTISISGYHIREAGSTAAQEIAFTLSNAIAYIDAALKAGLAIDDFAPRLSFFFNAHNDFLEEVAKFRAARRVYANLLRDRFHAKDPKSLLLRFHTQTAGSSLQAQQPEVNIVRTTIQALAAVLGGTQSLHTNAMDEAIGLPTESAATLALRTQQVIAHESGVPAYPDPFGGSHVIEALTDKLEREALAYIEKIDAMGGALTAIEEGYQQAEIHDAAYRYQQRIESGDQIVVGVNKFIATEPAKTPVFQIDPTIERQQADRLRDLRASRSAERVDNALTQMEAAARTSDNLMPPILSAAKELATVGEIATALRRVFGEHR